MLPSFVLALKDCVKLLHVCEHSSYGYMLVCCVVLSFSQSALLCSLKFVFSSHVIPPFFAWSMFFFYFHCLLLSYWASFRHAECGIQNEQGRHHFHVPSLTCANQTVHLHVVLSSILCPLWCLQVTTICLTSVGKSTHREAAIFIDANAVSPLGIVKHIRLHLFYIFMCIFYWL